MSITPSEMNLEKRNLKETNYLVNQLIKLTHKDNEKFKVKTSQLKKQARGTYSYEFENMKQLYNIVNNKFKNYMSVKGKPYFTRIDFKEKIHDKETLYIGKIDIPNEDNTDEAVIDWRAPIADLYYSSTEGKALYESPIGEIEGELLLKRKFIIEQGELLEAFDEGINQIILKNSDNPDEEEGLTDEFLKIMLDEGVSSKLKDVVATIQKEQNDIIRAPKEKPLIIQGSAGSGKTTVALHRLAYLLYRYKNSIKGNNILVLVPNKLFLDYIGEVLPSLGVNRVKQTTFESIACEILKIKNKIFPKEEKLAEILEEDKDKVKFISISSKLKGSIIFKNIIDNYLKYIERSFINYDDINIEGYTLIKKQQIKKLFVTELSYLPLEKRKQELIRYINAKLNRNIDKIPNSIYEYMRNELINNFEKNIIDSDDLAPMLYLKFKINGLDNEYKYKHIVIDEAQDYSIFQFYVIKNMSKGNSFTIVGDIGQGIYYYKGINDWDKLSKQVYTAHTQYIPLSQSYRSTVEIVNFANKVLRKQDNNIKPAKPVLRHGNAPKVIELSNELEFIKKLDKVVEEMNNEGRKNTVKINGILLKVTISL